MKKNKIYIDFGSFTTKIYKLDNKLKHLANISLPLKEGFDPEIGFSPTNQTQLFETIKSVKKQHPNTPVRVFATAIFRKMTKKAQEQFRDQLFVETGVLVNIIDHDLENSYLEMALVQKSNLGEPVLLLNIGGGSTEIVIMKGLEVIERLNLDLGVATINQTFPGINDQVASIDDSEVLKIVKKHLTKLNYLIKVGFYSGGELTYMRLTGYNLTKNILFNDKEHPSQVTLKDFQLKNKLVLFKTHLDNLCELMPENPTWMHGARGSSLLAQAIFEFYKIKTIIPSDADLIHGVVRQEYRTVTLSGSFRKHLPFILEVKTLLEANGVKILSPRFTEPKNPGEEFVVFTGEEGLSPLELERHHLDSIAKSDALIICDPSGYVGASALIEIGYAHALGKRVIFVETPEEFMLNTLPAEIGI